MRIVFATFVIFAWITFIFGDYDNNAVNSNVIYNAVYQKSLVVRKLISSAQAPVSGPKPTEAATKISVNRRHSEEILAVEHSTEIEMVNPMIAIFKYSFET